MESSPTAPIGRILVLCTGNICRSPYIERRLAAELADTDAVVESAGTGALVGNPIDPSSVTVLERDGGSSVDFAARQATAELLRDADLVIGATREHIGEAARLDASVLRKGFALRDLANLLGGVQPETIRNAPGRTRAAQVAAEALMRRSEVEPLSPRDSAVADPFQQEARAFDAMGESVAWALPTIVAALRV